MKTDSEVIGLILAQVDISRKKYPDGCTVLSIADEAGEVVHAVNKYESEDKVRQEILDLLSVGFRLLRGEIDMTRSVRGFKQVRDEPEEKCTGTITHCEFTYCPKHDGKGKETRKVFSR